MAVQGTTLVDFGAFPGKTDVTVAVSSPTITAGVLVEAWIFPANTGTLGTATYRTADEHILEPVKVVAHSVVAGVGFSITAVIESVGGEPLHQRLSRNTTIAGGLTAQQSYQVERTGGKGLRLHGAFNVAWVWN